MIAVIDYGMGNLRSVAKGLEKVGASPKVTSSSQDIADAAGVVLPGVGAFPDCIANLDRLNLVEPIISSIHSGKPFLGICLGLQALFSESEEFGKTPGLDVFPGRVVRFPDGLYEQEDGGPENRPLKIPHMGWNSITKKVGSPCLSNIDDESYFYFVHSYYIEPEDESIIATVTHYGMDFVSSVAKDNLFASQFHPEKSQALGLKVLENFNNLVSGS